MKHILSNVFAGLRAYYYDEATYYIAYHQNTVNWRIHAICIPMEWLSWLLLLSYIKLQWIVSTFVCVYYCMLGSNSAYLAASAIVGLVFLADVITSYCGSSDVWMVAIIMQVIAWSVQILIGHHIYERNSPAMVDRFTLNSVILCVALAWETAESYWPPARSMQATTKKE